MIEYKVVSVMSKMQRTVTSVINMCITGIFFEADMYFSQSSQSYSTSYCIYSSKIG
jgi:hypothetical protein